MFFELKRFICGIKRRSWWVFKDQGDVSCRCSGWWGWQVPWGLMFLGCGLGHSPWSCRAWLKLRVLSQGWGLGWDPHRKGSTEVTEEEKGSLNLSFRICGVVLKGFVPWTLQALGRATSQTPSPPGFLLSPAHHICDLCPLLSPPMVCQGERNNSGANTENNLNTLNQIGVFHRDHFLLFCLSWELLRKDKAIRAFFTPSIFFLYI